jgi:FKBP-type peptidyl-prolyl cis-trans isomerase
LITNGVALKAGQETNVDAISLIPEVLDDMKVNHVLMPEGGDLIQAPSLVTMHYTGRLKDGTVFDSSV